MFKRILVPLDGSSTASRGFDQGLGLARSHGSRLFLLHVVDEHVLIQHSDGMAQLTEQYLESMRESGEKVLAAAQAKAARRGVDCRTVMIENIARSVADIIVEQAKKLRADVIVMGTHGRRGVKRLVLGSDAEGVVRTSPVPVLLVRDREKPRTV
jgi:nucleotide-binding universal stress UspA family protein